MSLSNSLIVAKASQPNGAASVLTPQLNSKSIIFFS